MSSVINLFLFDLIPPAECFELIWFRGDGFTRDKVFVGNYDLPSDPSDELRFSENNYIEHRNTNGH